MVIGTCSTCDDEDDYQSDVQAAAGGLTQTAMEW